MTEGGTLRCDVAIGARALDGNLVVPNDAPALVIFAHESGGSRLSAGCSRVADGLQSQGFATLQMDLLTDTGVRHVSETYQISLMAMHLCEAIFWARARQEVRSLQICLFGDGLGGAAALLAGSDMAEEIAAVACQGGQPELAGAALDAVLPPALLIAAGADIEAVRRNRLAFARISAPKRLVIIPDAEPSFAATGAFGELVQQTRIWFHEHTSQPPDPRA